MYSLISGFVSPGETIEDAVRREVLEETGVKVGRVEYAGSQPWPFASEIMIGCWSQSVDDRICVDENELETAAWFTMEEVQQGIENSIKATKTSFWSGTEFRLPPPFAIGHIMVRELLKHRGLQFQSML